MASPHQVCGCPTNGAGDIRCHVCSEYVKKRCWRCKTPRGEGPCPNPLPAPPVYVLVYRQCGHRILATANWEVAVRITERCGSVMVQEASNDDLLDLAPDQAALYTGDRVAGLRGLLTGLAHKGTCVSRTRPRACWCRSNDAKVMATWQRLAHALINGVDLDRVTW